MEFDGDISIDLAALRPLVQQYREKPLLLLKWCPGRAICIDCWRYWHDCEPWDCFIRECDDMLTNRTDYVKTSYENIVKWKEDVLSPAVG